MATNNQINMAFNAFIDDDSMATASATNVCSGESIKAYVDAQVVAANSGGLKSIQVFDASGTWTKPSGIDQVLVHVVGGGGAGGSSLGGASVASAGGGGAGGFSQKLIDVTGIASETVTVGAGGTPGAAGNNAGGNGGDTTFGAHCTGGGGLGGGGSPSSAYSGNQGGDGGLGSGGDINSSGGPGQQGGTRNGNATAGMGGNSFFGGGARSKGTGDGLDGVSAGGGGAGAVSTTVSYQGGAGAAGIVIVYEYSTSASNPVGNVAPVGAILSFASTTPPVGFLECDGSAVSRTTYSELFAAIGTTWGVGDGSTTFNLPNLERSVAVGSGGTGTSTLGNAVGDTGGEEDHTITTTELPANTINYSTATLTNHIGSNTGAAGYYPALNAAVWNSNGGGAANIIQPSVVVLMCIAYQANVVADATAASQAEMEAATSTTVFSTPGRQQLHPGHPKAWVVFNGTGTVAIDAAYNVTSITDNGVGDYTVNFTTAFADGFYAGMGTCGNEVSQNYLSATAAYIMGPQAVPTTTAWRFGTGQGAVSAEPGVRADMSNISVAFFGDQ